MLSSFVNNFAGFAVVAVTFVAMVGVGVAEKAGMMGALIRKLVSVAPAALLGFFIIFVGVLSSVASDAGYLILIPLARPRSPASDVTRWPGWPPPTPASVASSPSTSLITPVDSMLTEITNEAIGQTGAETSTSPPTTTSRSPRPSVLAIVAVVVTQTHRRAPASGAYDAARRPAFQQQRGCSTSSTTAGEARACGTPSTALLVMVVLIALLTVAQRSTAARARDRRHHRQHPVHVEPDLPHLADLPDLRHLLRHRGARPSPAATTSSRASRKPSPDSPD